MLKCKNIQIFFLQPKPILSVPPTPSLPASSLPSSITLYQPHPGVHLPWLPITITLPLYFINMGSQGAADSNGPWRSCKKTAVSNLSQFNRFTLNILTLLVSWTWEYRGVLEKEVTEYSYQPQPLVWKKNMISYYIIDHVVYLQCFFDGLTFYMVQAAGKT